MSERVPAVVVGGGVIGAAILREFASRGIQALLIEAQPDLAEGATKANSAIVHTGFDAVPGTTEAAMLQRSRVLWPRLIDDLGVPFLSVGALMVARNEDERGQLLGRVAPNAAALGVDATMLEADELRSVAPYLADDVQSALAIPGEGVIDPFWLARAHVEAALGGGASFRVQDAVVGLRVRDDAITVELRSGATIDTEVVVDAAGLQADDVARLASDESFSITPRKGQFLVSEEIFGVDRIVLPLPGPRGKGMLVTPIVFGGLLLGPTAVDQTDKHDRSTNEEASAQILAACRAIVPAVAEMVPIRAFAGLRTVSSTGDYVIRASDVSDRLWFACGVRSTGISASPAIAEHVVEAVAHRRGWTLADPPKSLRAPGLDLSAEPGDVVCLCRGVSRGEIVGACRGPTKPATLDALKRRCGVLLGDCQGNMCATTVASILALEQARPITEIEQGAEGSWVVAGSSKGPPRDIDDIPELPLRADVVVIGGGRAGRAAAASVSRSVGARVVILERNDGWTVTGLVPQDGEWLVLAQSRSGSAEVVASRVIVATGGYVPPREHRLRIAGPRPAGIVTADFVAAAQRLNLLVGRAIALVGRTRAADELAALLLDAGGAVTRFDREPDEVAGGARLKAVRYGDSWTPADTLVLADRLISSTFLLRDLGLVDGRPGIPAPADAAGRLPLAGLYATGCCVSPDIDHASCEAEGDRVGSLVADELPVGRTPARSVP